MSDRASDTTAQNLARLRKSLVSALRDKRFTEQDFQALKGERDTFGRSRQSVRTLRPSIDHLAYLRVSQQGKVSSTQADRLDWLSQFSTVHVLNNDRAVKLFPQGWDGAARP